MVWTFSSEQTLGASVQKLRVIVLDRYSNSTGTVTIPVAQ